MGARTGGCLLGAHPSPKGGARGWRRRGRATWACPAEQVVGGIPAHRLPRCRPARLTLVQLTGPPPSEPVSRPPALEGSHRCPQAQPRPPCCHVTTAVFRGPGNRLASVWPQSCWRLSWAVPQAAPSASGNSRFLVSLRPRGLWAQPRLCFLPGSEDPTQEKFPKCLCR